LVLVRSLPEVPLANVRCVFLCPRLVRRDHLHAGLTESARRHGVELIVAARVQTLEHSANSVKVTTTEGVNYTFDLLIGSDGIKSTIRQSLFPTVVPQAASKVAAFRGILSYEEVFAKVPNARLILRNTMDSWIGPNGYILLYPLSGGRELNVVTLFQMDYVVTTPETIDIEEFRNLYRDWDPVARKILELVNYTQKWPLLVLPPMKTWSNEHKNVVLLGDAAHCMQNHMVGSRLLKNGHGRLTDCRSQAQGAATAMEDGAFLGRVISEVVRGVITLPEAIDLYEKKRMPRVWIKQQASFVSGTLNMALGDDAAKRKLASAPEVTAASRNVARPSNDLPPQYRAWQMFCTPSSVPGILYYDAEGDADNAVCEFLQSKTEMDERTLVTKGLWDKWWGVVDYNGMPSSS
jgi:salicylate hydroxylase